MTESVLLSLIGGAIGVALSVGLTRGLIALIPQQPLLIVRHRPSYPDVTFALTLVTGVVFGLLPALRASKPDQWATLKDTVGAVAGTGGSLFLRKGLVAAQVALSFLLLFGAGLFVRSLQNLQTTDTGMQLDNLVMFRLSPALGGYTHARANNFYTELLDRLRLGRHHRGRDGGRLAPRRRRMGQHHGVEGHQAKDGEDMQAFMNALSPGYFSTMGIRFLEGRDFRPLDLKESSDVAIVNRKFAQHFFGEKSAIGKRIGRGSGPNTKFNVEIIGVVEDSLYEDRARACGGRCSGRPGATAASFYVRTTEASAGAFNVIRNEVKRLDASMPVYDMKTVQGQLDETLLTDRLIALLSAGFGLLATLLASTAVWRDGLHRCPAKEGDRHPAGPRRRALWRAVDRDEGSADPAGDRPRRRHSGSHRPRPLRVVAAIGIQPNDPWIGCRPALLAAVSSAAGMIPATRASKIDPILALRYE